MTREDEDTLTEQERFMRAFSRLLETGVAVAITTRPVLHTQRVSSHGAAHQVVQHTGRYGVEIVLEKQVVTFDFDRGDLVGLGVGQRGQP